MSGDARCEGFLDVYGGWVVDSRADVSVSETRSSGTTTAVASGELTSSAAFGARMGAWHPTYSWLGLGMDLGYLDAKGSGLGAKIFPISLFLAARAPLFATSEFPSGRLQPYAMGGLTIPVIDISVEVNGIGGSSTLGCLPLGYGGCDDTVVAPYLVAGVAWQPARNLALFAEYRHSQFSANFDTTNSFLFPTMNGRVDVSFSTEHVILGISYRFATGGAGTLRDSQQTGPPGR